MDNNAKQERPRGRRQPLSESRQTLAEQYLPLARAMARPLKRAWPWAGDEFESAACMALVEAAESFDPERNVRFATFARLRIRGALRDVQRQLAPGGWRTDAAHAPLVGPLCADPESRGRVVNAEPDPPVDESVAALDEVDHWLRKLPPRHAEACRQIYLHGRTQTEAAHQMGCSQSRLSYMHREALAMLNGSWYAQLAEQTPSDIL